MKKVAFTLAEVLITLTVIGVVAAVVVPSVVIRNTERTLVAQAQKVYNTINNAYYKMQMLDPEAVIRMGNSGYIVDELKAHLNLANDCGTGTGCFPSVVYIDKSGNTIADYNSDTSGKKIELADGTAMFSNEPNEIIVDINGEDGPNTMGKDLHTFVFDLNSSKVAPYAVTSENCNGSNPASQSCSYCMVFKDSVECDIPTGLNITPRDLGDTTPWTN